MIRTLSFIAVVSFVLAIICIASATAIVGGPFLIDDAGRFHRTTWDDAQVVRRQILRTAAPHETLPPVSAS